MTTANYIEFLHSSKSTDKETSPKAQNLRSVLHFIELRKFTGQVNVYVDGNIVYELACVNGALHGRFVKFTTFVPSTWTGSVSGYLSRNWRQPEIVLNFRNGLLDGQATITKADGTKSFVLVYSMGLLQGEQKHYTAPLTRVIHTYEKGQWVSSAKQYKNWLPRWGLEVDEVASHKEVKLINSKIVDGIAQR